MYLLNRGSIDDNLLQRLFTSDIVMITAMGVLAAAGGTVGVMWIGGGLSLMISSLQLVWSALFSFFFLSRKTPLKKAFSLLVVCIGVGSIGLDSLTPSSDGLKDLHRGAEEANSPMSIEEEMDTMTDTLFPLGVAGALFNSLMSSAQMIVIEKAMVRFREISKQYSAETISRRQVVGPLGGDEESLALGGESIADVKATAGRDAQPTTQPPSSGPTTEEVGENVTVYICILCGFTGVVMCSFMFLSFSLTIGVSDLLTAFVKVGVFPTALFYSTLTALAASLQFGYFKMLDISNAAVLSLLFSFRAVFALLASSLLNCSQDPSQCMTGQKWMSVLVTMIGVGSYSISP